MDGIVCVSYSIQCQVTVDGVTKRGLCRACRALRRGDFTLDTLKDLFSGTRRRYKLLLKTKTDTFISVRRVKDKLNISPRVVAKAVSYSRRKSRKLLFGAIYAFKAGGKITDIGKIATNGSRTDARTKTSNAIRLKNGIDITFILVLLVCQRNATTRRNRVQMVINSLKSFHINLTYYLSRRMRGRERARHLPSRRQKEPTR